jgi:hypothetical protein
LALLALCSLGFGCGSRNKDLEKPIGLLDPPVAIGDQLVLVDKDNHQALMLSVSGAQLEAATTRVDLPREPRLAVRRNGTDNEEALILCKGQRASAKDMAEPAELAVLTAKGTLRHYILGNPFDTLVQSDDGQYAFLFKSTSAETLLDNPNEIAIVDLSKDPKTQKMDAVRSRTLRSFGDSPLAVIFSPMMHIVNQDRRLAVVLSKTNVTLIDLFNLDRQETTVQLSEPGGQAVEPTQVMFSSDTSEIYVRGASSSDVFVFSLVPRDAGGSTDDTGEPHNDFKPSIDQLGVGGRPSDMTLYQADTGGRLLVLSADTQQASVVDASTSQVTSVKLPEAASRILLFKATSPHDAQTAERALLYQPMASSLTFLDLADLEQRGTRNLEQLALEHPIAKLIPLLQEQRVLIIHDSGGVSLIDLAGRTVSPIRSTAPLQDALFDADLHRLWVGPSGLDRVGWLDLLNGSTHEVLLDANIQTVVPMFKQKHVVILHDSTVGYATVLDAMSPSRETAKSVRGFLIADLLNRGQ